MKNDFFLLRRKIIGLGESLKERGVKDGACITFFFGGENGMRGG